MQSVYEMGWTKDTRAILCLEEYVVTGAADGYTRMARNLHLRCCTWAAASPTA